MEALAILDQVPRVVPRVVAAVIEFNLNAWERVHPPAELRDIVRAVEFFRGIAAMRSTGPETVGNGAAERPICPLDLATDTIVQGVRVFLVAEGKGVFVEFEGRVHTSKFEADGETKYSTEVVVDKRSVNIVTK